MGFSKYPCVFELRGHEARCNGGGYDGCACSQYTLKQLKEIEMGCSCGFGENCNGYGCGETVNAVDTVKKVLEEKIIQLAAEREEIKKRSDELWNQITKLHKALELL